MTATVTAEADVVSVSLDDRIAAVCGHLNACYAELVELLERGHRHRGVGRAGDSFGRALDRLAHRPVGGALPHACGVGGCLRRPTRG